MVVLDWFAYKVTWRSFASPTRKNFGWKSCIL